MRHVEWRFPRAALRWTLCDGSHEVATLTDVPTAMDAQASIRGVQWNLSCSRSRRELEARGPGGEVATASVGWVRGGEVRLADGTVYGLTRGWGPWWKLAGPSGLALKQRHRGWDRTVEVWVADDMMDQRPQVVVLTLYAMITRPRWY